MSTIPPQMQRIMTHIFEMFGSWLWALVGLAWLFNFQRTAIHSPVGHDIARIWPYAWSILYLAAAAMITYGVVCRHPGFRAAGLVTLITGLVMQTVVVFDAPFDFRSLTYPLWIVACCLKVKMLFGVYNENRRYEL